MFKYKQCYKFMTQGTFMKKFYKKAQVELYQNKYTVKLDGRTVKSPSQHVIVMPSVELAQLVAHEFNSQHEYLKSGIMPLLTLTRTAVDIELNSDEQKEILRKNLETSLLAYLQNDTAYFRELALPKLHKIQTEKLDKILEFINKRLLLNFKTQTGFDINVISEQQQLNFISELQKINNFQLLALETIASNLKSTSLAIALLENFISIEQALEYSRLEENFQINLFGKVEGSHDLDENTTLVNISSAKIFYDFSQNIQ